MEVNGSTLRTSVFMTPEPSILVPSPPLVMQSPHSDQLQAVRKSRHDRTAAIRNMAHSSNGAAVESRWRGATAIRRALDHDPIRLNRDHVLALCLSMILFRKPVPTFRDHALVGDEFLFDG